MFVHGIRFECCNTVGAWLNWMASHRMSSSSFKNNHQNRIFFMVVTERKQKTKPKPTAHTSFTSYLHMYGLQCCTVYELLSLFLDIDPIYIGLSFCCHVHYSSHTRRVTIQTQSGCVAFEFVHAKTNWTAIVKCNLLAAQHTAQQTNASAQIYSHTNAL